MFTVAIENSGRFKQRTRAIQTLTMNIYKTPTLVVSCTPLKSMLELALMFDVTLRPALTDLLAALDSYLINDSERIRMPTNTWGTRQTVTYNGQDVIAWVMA